MQGVYFTHKLSSITYVYILFKIDMNGNYSYLSPFNCYLNGLNLLYSVLTMNSLF